MSQGGNEFDECLGRLSWHGYAGLNKPMNGTCKVVVRYPVMRTVPVRGWRAPAMKNDFHQSIRLPPRALIAVEFVRNHKFKIPIA